MIWKKLPDFDNYEFSNNGEVRNVITNNELKGSCDDKGFIRMTLKNNDNKAIGIQVHTSVAKLFINNPNNYKVVRHIDDNKLNNNVTNLMWVPQVTKIVKYEPIEGEVWKQVENIDRCEVSNKGRIRNKFMNSLLSSKKSMNGYMEIVIDRKTYFVHRLVALAFIPNLENKPTVDHVDRNRTNNNLENLRWNTVKEQTMNMKYKYVIPMRKINRIDIKTDEVLQTHDNLEESIKWIIYNKLSESTNKNSIRSHLSTSLNDESNTKSCYGYKWKYTVNEDIEGEIWKSIKDVMPKAADHLISNMGRIKNAKNLIVDGSVRAGYQMVYIGKEYKKQRLHILVAKLFIPNPENKECVNHKNGIKTDNRVSNLEWISQKDNVLHAIQTNLNHAVIKVKVTNLGTKEEKIYSAKRYACNTLNIDERKFNKHLKNQTPYNNLMFTLA